LKLGTRDKIIIAIFGAVLFFFAAYKLVWTPVGGKITALQEEKEQVKALSADITPLIEQKQKLKNEEKGLKNSVDNIKESSGGITTTNEEFLVFLGENTKKYNVQLIGFNDLGLEEHDGVYTETFNFELRGSAYNINRILSEIEYLGIRTSYGSVSFRQNERYDYLKRYFDDMTELPWYTEPEEKPEDENKEEETPEEEEIIDIPEITPEYVPSAPAITIPEPYYQPSQPQIQVPAEPEPPKQGEKDKTINDRLNRLLEQTSSNGKYKVVFLTNTYDDYTDDKYFDNGEYEEDEDMFGLFPRSYGREMRLAVTVRFIMFNEPSEETSFLYGRDVEPDGIL